MSDFVFLSPDRKLIFRMGDYSFYDDLTYTYTVPLYGSPGYIPVTHEYKVVDGKLCTALEAPLHDLFQQAYQQYLNKLITETA